MPHPLDILAVILAWLVLMVVVSGCAPQLRQPDTLRISIEEYEWEFDGSPGMLVKVPVVCGDKSGRFAVEVALGRTLSETWNVSLIDLYDEAAEKRVDSVQVWATEQSGYCNPQKARTYFDTSQLSGRGRIEVYLHQAERGAP